MSNNDINPQATILNSQVKLFGVKYTGTVWVCLCLIALLLAYFAQVSLEPAIVAFVIATLPAFLSLILQFSVKSGELSDIWVCFAWLGVGLTIAAFTGGAFSPLLLMLAFGPLYAISQGHFRVGVEISVFAAIGYVALAAFSVLGVSLPSVELNTFTIGTMILISLLQVGVFIAAAQSKQVSLTKFRSELQNWTDFLEGVPVRILKLDHRGVVIGSIGSDDVVGGLETDQLIGRSFYSLFENAENITSPDGESHVLMASWDAEQMFEARLSRVGREYRLILAELDAERRNSPELVDDESQIKWVASLGHELKNMLNPVSGYSDLITSERAGPVEDVYKDFAKSIKQGAEHLGLLVEDLMMAAKSQAGYLKLCPETLDIRLEIEDAIKLISWQSEAYTVSVLLSDGADAFVWADQKAARQILINLMSNAIKYSKPRGLVKVKVLKNDSKVQIEIKDSGEGMGPEELEHIGEAFFQGNNAKGRAGTGLGLSIVSLLVHKMDGEFKLESELGVGTIATVSLPISKAQSTQQRAREAEAS